MGNTDSKANIRILDNKEPSAIGKPPRSANRPKLPNTANNTPLMKQPRTLSRNNLSRGYQS